MISDKQLLVLLRSERRVALWGDLVRAAIAGVVLIVIALYLVYYAVLVRFMVTELHMNDFGKFYYSAQMFLDGQDMYGPSPATEIPIRENEMRQFWNMNPPHFHLLLLPLARLPPMLALLIWGLLSTAALVWSLRVIGSEVGLRWRAAGMLLTLLAVIVCSATGMVVITGQLTFLLLLPVTLSWTAARRGQLARAGTYLGVVASVKPFMGIFLIYWVARRQWRAAAAMTITGLTGAIIGLSVFGFDTHLSWVNALGQVEWPWATMNASVTGILARTFGDSPFFAPVIRAPQLVRPLSTILSVGIGLLTLGLVVRDQTAEQHDRAYAALIAAALLVSPLGWMYYLPWLCGPIVALIATSRRRPSRTRLVLAYSTLPGLVLPLLVTAVWQDSRWAGVTAGSVYGWTVLLMWAAILADRRPSMHGSHPALPR